MPKITSNVVTVGVAEPIEVYQLTLHITVEQAIIDVGETLNLSGSLQKLFFVDDIPVGSAGVPGVAVILYIDAVSSGITAVTDAYGNYTMAWVPTLEDVGSHDLYTETAVALSAIAAVGVIEIEVPNGKVLLPAALSVITGLGLLFVSRRR